MRERMLQTRGAGTADLLDGRPIPSFKLGRWWSRIPHPSPRAHSGHAVSREFNFDPCGSIICGQNLELHGFIPAVRAGASRTTASPLCRMTESGNAAQGQMSQGLSVSLWISDY